MIECAEKTLAHTPYGLSFCGAVLCGAIVFTQWRFPARSKSPP